MKSQINLIIINIFILLISLSLISAVIVDSVTVDKLLPGQTSLLKISVKNNLDDDVDDVSFVLKLEDTSFTTIGSSEDSEAEIREGKVSGFKS